MKTLFLCALAFGLFAFLTPSDPLTGKWISKPSFKGNVTSVEFKSDNTFEGFINRKAFVTGTYTLSDSVFSFVDNGCEGMQGVYKVIFFSYGDSIRFQPIVDSCFQRMQGMSSIVLGKDK